ncbi:LysR family transcriptional regulator [Secundilactobacillus silagei]|uniref:LysR family transcriptional regulator n=1 Tax=Secundilactobacillus silagei JCM 19001 TaxID=1302250 RepID=A0A1Z5H3S7_9LACO|nr:LysR family transcriptional regulator [Secundilactobacillus silagei]TDG70275.1 hypothetical protein C5L25_001465 [Secundilactobacillus silagei JCM 19001]GAT17953.1 LysR family transcriptional regulator [Secundilactobacillus silagei JCM 19001]
MSTHRTLLNILKTVEYSQTLSDVAERLYISQPYISKLLKETENNYHVTLVTRTKPVKLTSAGMTMINGLQSIVDEENQLKDTLVTNSELHHQPIHIAMTDPFLSSIVSGAMTKYYAQHSERKLDIKLINDLSVVNEADMSNVDILIGKRIRDPHFSQIELPSRQLSLFISSHCQTFDPKLLYQRFQNGSLEALNDYSYVGFAGYDIFQRYVDLSFKKESINLATSITVPTAADALEAVNNIPHATTITTLATAQRVFPDHNFNLMPLPANFISLETTISYRDMTNDSEIIEIARYLYGELQKSDNSVAV